MCYIVTGSIGRKRSALHGRYLAEEYNPRLINDDDIYRKIHKKAKIANPEK
jgi:hypothetical protein